MIIEPEKENSDSEENRFKTPPLGETGEGSNIRRREESEYFRWKRLLTEPQSKKGESKEGESREGKQAEMPDRNRRDFFFGRRRPAPRDEKDLKKESGIFGDKKVIEKRDIQKRIEDRGLYHDTKMTTQERKDFFQKNFGPEGRFAKIKYLREDQIKKFRKDFKKSTPKGNYEQRRDFTRKSKLIEKVFGPEKKRR
jgi:hypothetical protein